MAEGVIVLLLEKVVDFARNEISKVATAKGELDKLKQELRSIQPILRAAHVKLFTLKEDAEEVKGWILRINEVAYDALDLIDLYRAVQERGNTNETPSKQSRVLKFLNSPFKASNNIFLLREIADKIKEINERFSVVYREKDLYGLKSIGEASSSAYDMNGTWERRQTTENVVVPSFIGRDKDKEMIVKWLLEQKQGIQQSACVAAIVGMGGVGKTTLAKAICNDSTVTKTFEKSIWVCVSKSPNLLDLFKKILEEVDAKQEGFTSRLISLNALNSRIKKQLTKHKFLLILDDVWDSEWWKELAGLWRGGQPGSKVLVTTRNVTVANEMKSNRLFKMEGLNYEESRQLFVNEVLQEGESEEELERVEEFVQAIVRRCAGLPLALNVVGGVMRHKERNGLVWQDVLRSPLWNWEGPGSQDHGSIFSAIALSYMFISFPLKQCLTYCSIFPKDFEMKKKDLLRLWMAEGFIREAEEDMEVSAERYLEALVACNLIQVGEWGGYTFYTLHDIVHDFALYIRGKEHVNADLLRSDDRKVPQNARTCALVGEECSLEGLSQQKLRSLLLLEIHPFLCTGFIASFAAFKWLRVLDLRDTRICSLPKSIGEMVLLRYLNLSRTQITELPESMINLRDLQTLDLSYTPVERLPHKLSCFSTMRHLDLKKTKLLKYLPKEIGKLTNLRTLHKFVVGCSAAQRWESGLTELCDLNNLKGFLAIRHLERIHSEEECMLAHLQKKKRLERLELSCWTDTVVMESPEVLARSTTGNESMKYDEGLSRKMERAFEALQPPANILEITIVNFPGVSLPNWMQCHYSIPFHCLQRVHLYDCKFLLEWRFNGALEKENMPFLLGLHVSGCPKLRILPFFPTLEELILGEEMDSFQGWDMTKGPREWPCLKSVEIEGPCPKMKSLPDSAVLQSMNMENLAFFFPNGKMLSCSLQIDSLEMSNRFGGVLLGLNHKIDALEIRELRGLDSLPEWLLQLHQLRSLELANGKELTHLQDQLKNLTKLEVFSLRSMPQLSILPDALACLCQLEKLVIHECPKLSLLPHWVKNLPRLQKLIIQSCPDLVNRCRNEDWHIISHIRNVDLVEL